MERLTYKSFMGDYGLNFNVDNMEIYEVIHKLANKLGKYEDLGMSPEDILKMIEDNK